MTTSSSLAPLIREYERTSTTTANAYTAPLFSRYIVKLSKDLSELSYRGALKFMQSNGGLCSVETAQSRFITTLLSSPAAGVAGMLYLNKILGWQNILSLDMGERSCQACLIHEGKADVTYETNMANQAISFPMLGIGEVGPGGGSSIVWADSGGAIRVGPRHAEPLGPVSYMMGGKELTLTDVNLTLGYTNPQYFLGGEMKVDKEAAAHTLKDMFASTTGINSAEDIAALAFDVANAMIIGDINEKVMQKGYDLSGFNLIAFGGCGPIHATRIAPLLGISRVIVPMNAGTFSAFGLLAADIQYDYVKVLIPEKSRDIGYLNNEYEKMENEGKEALQMEDIPEERRYLNKTIVMRYALETHGITLPLPEDAITSGSIKKLEKVFHEQHERFFGHKMLEHAVVIMSLYLSAIGLPEKPTIPQIRSSGPNPARAKKAERKVYFPDVGEIVTTIYERALLLAGNSIQGPAVIEEAYSTTVVFPGQKAQVDRYGNLIVEV
ncbi:hydantoinase/oxoprolinase family protein [Chloroflexota bacterium]